MWLLRSPLARAPYVVVFDLKPLIEDGNLQAYMYCVHARKRASGAPRTHFRACKNLKGRAPDPPHTIHFGGPQFLYLPWAPPILSAALVVTSRFHSICELSKSLITCRASMPHFRSLASQATSAASTLEGVPRLLVAAPSKWVGNMHWIVPSTHANSIQCILQAATRPADYHTFMKE